MKFKEHSKNSFVSFQTSLVAEHFVGTDAVTSHHTSGHCHCGLSKSVLLSLPLFCKDALAKFFVPVNMCELTDNVCM